MICNYLIITLYDVTFSYIRFFFFHIQNSDTYKVSPEHLRSCPSSHLQMSKTQEQRCKHLMKNSIFWFDCHVGEAVASYSLWEKVRNRKNTSTCTHKEEEEKEKERKNETTERREWIWKRDWGVGGQQFLRDNVEIENVRQTDQTLDDAVSLTAREEPSPRERATPALLPRSTSAV